ncbi:MAG: RNA methyltransferase [Eubacterium sp.]|nr:RNA methyltransferase [Eubacterium sp.]
MLTSSSNEQIRHIIQLNTKAKARREENCFVAEGIKLFRETPEELRRRVYVSESFEREHRDLLGSTAYETVEDRLFAKICDTQTPQGILTIASMPSYTREKLLGSGTPLVMVLEDLQDPGNVGTILRTAEGAGVTGVFLSSRTADIFQPKVIRSTMGSVYRVPFRREENLSEVVAWLKTKGVRTYAAHLQGKNSYSKEDYTGPTAFLIGNEGRGLTDELTAAADVKVRIPMEGRVESLNAAVASALFMYAAHESRG